MKDGLSRRAFLGACGAGAIRLVQTDSPYRIGLETYCFHDVPFDAMLTHVNALGLRYIELHDGHLKPGTSAADIARARARLHDAGVTPTGVYIHDAYTADERVTRPILDFAKAVGFRYITGGPRREALPLLDRLAGEYKIDLAIHNHGPGARYETLEHVTAVLDEYKNLSTVVDIGHYARSKVDPVLAIRTVGKRAVAVHVKDVDRGGKNTIVGEGTIDLPAVFAALAGTRFGGLLLLEYEADWEPIPQRLDGMRKSLEHMHRLIAAARRR